MRICDRCAAIKNTTRYSLEEESVVLTGSTTVTVNQMFKWTYDLCNPCEKELRFRIQQFLINDLSGKVISND